MTSLLLKAGYWLACVLGHPIFSPLSRSSNRPASLPALRALSRLTEPRITRHPAWGGYSTRLSSFHVSQGVHHA